MSDQYLRKVSLVVSAGTSGLDLSQMRIYFKTTQSDVQTPNRALMRVYNLSDQTATSVQKEFTAVQLQAGYETGAFGTIFSGTIKQVIKRRISPVDTVVDIYGADGDIAYNQGFISKTLAAGATLTDERNALITASGLPAGYVADMPPGAAQRGQVKYGMVRDHMRDVANAGDMTWSIQNGQIQMIPKTGYRPGTAVVLNSNTGMIDRPQVTEGGIETKCLLNPNIGIGSLLQIDNTSIQGTPLGGTLLNTPGRLEALKGFQPSISADGLYKVYVNEFEGDTRGGEAAPWWNLITCLAVDQSAPAGQSVQNPF